MPRVVLCIESASLNFQRLTAAENQRMDFYKLHIYYTGASSQVDRRVFVGLQ